MIHVGQKIKIALDQQGKKYIAAAREVGMTEGNLQKVFKRDHIDTELLTKFSRITGKSVGWFLDEKNTTPSINFEPEQKGNAKLNIDNNGIRVKIKIEIELDPDQITRAEDIRQRIIKALK